MSNYLQNSCSKEESSKPYHPPFLLGFMHFYWLSFLFVISVKRAAKYEIQKPTHNLSRHTSKFVVRQVASLMKNEQQSQNLSLKAMLHEAIFPATCNATMTTNGRSTFLATRNATIADGCKMGCCTWIFSCTLQRNVALQVARKIASCNMAFKVDRRSTFHNKFLQPATSVLLCDKLVTRGEKRETLTQNLKRNNIAG